ncbi:MAG: hypothetical protein ABSB88_02000 [Bryobacteraceae bacterium]
MTVRHRIGSTLTLLPVFLLLANGLQAQQCSPNTTAGGYVVACSGYLSPVPNGPLVPTKILGIAFADNRGTFKGSTTASIGGGIVKQTVNGTEQINVDCTGTITYAQTLNGQPGPPLDITFVVSNQGNRIDGLVTDSGAVLSCELRRISSVDPMEFGKLPTGNKETERLASRFAAIPASVQSGPDAMNYADQPVLISVVPHAPSDNDRLDVQKTTEPSMAKERKENR